MDRLDEATLELHRAICAEEAHRRHYQPIDEPSDTTWESSQNAIARNLIAQREEALANWRKALDEHIAAKLSDQKDLAVA